MKCLVTKKFYCPILKRRVQPGETIDVEKKYIEGYMPYVEIIKETLPTLPLPEVKRKLEPVWSTQDTKENETQDIANHKVDWESHTKNDLVKELVKRGIEFNKRQPKDELIALLESGD